MTIALYITEPNVPNTPCIYFTMRRQLLINMLAFHGRKAERNLIMSYL